MATSYTQEGAIVLGERCADAVLRGLDPYLDKSCVAHELADADQATKACVLFFVQGAKYGAGFPAAEMGPGPEFDPFASGASLTDRLLAVNDRFAPFRDTAAWILVAAIALITVGVWLGGSMILNQGACQPGGIQ